MLTHSLTIFLAQQQIRQYSAEILLALGGMLLLVVTVACVGTYLHRRMKRDADPVDSTFSLSDLRRLHREGHISDEEYERTRKLVLAQAQRVLERDRLAEESKRAEAEQHARRLDPYANQADGDVETDAHQRADTEDKETRDNPADGDADHDQEDDADRTDDADDDADNPPAGGTR